MASAPPDAPPDDRRATSLRPGERFRAWLVTGPLARFAAFVVEVGAALANVVRRRG